MAKNRGNVLLAIFFLPLVLFGQKNAFGLEFQAYPTGLIPSLRYEHALSNHDFVLVRIGYNWFRHRDLGIHDNEKGDGIGFSIGYKKRLALNASAWSFSFKNDFWWNKVAWYDVSSSNQKITGETDLVVLQPSIEAAYQLEITDTFTIAPSIAFGFEWNVKTKGEPTGEGAILLIGIQAMSRIEGK